MSNNKPEYLHPEIEYCTTLRIVSEKPFSQEDLDHIRYACTKYLDVDQNISSTISQKAISI